MSSFLSEIKELKCHAFCLYCLVLGYPKDRFTATLQVKQMIQLSLVEVGMDGGFPGLCCKNCQPCSTNPKPVGAQKPISLLPF